MTSEMGQWHPVAYYSQEIILAKTYYKTHNTELLAIVEAFKNWYHYLEGYQYKVLVLINRNNLRQFINMKSLSFCQVHLALELFRYYFRIDYCQVKANEAANTLFYYPHQSQGKEEIL